MPVNVSVNDDWIYQTISGTVKHAPILGNLGNYVKSNHKASAMLTTTPVAAMQILTLAVPLSEAYKSALDQFNKSAKKAEAPDYPLQRPLDYGSDKGNHKHIVFRNSL